MGGSLLHPWQGWEMMQPKASPGKAGRELWLWRAGDSVSPGRGECGSDCQGKQSLRAARVSASLPSPQPCAATASILSSFSLSRRWKSSGKNWRPRRGPLLCAVKSGTEDGERACNQQETFSGHYVLMGLATLYPIILFYFSGDRVSCCPGWPQTC